MQTNILTLALLFFPKVKLEHEISNLGYHLEKEHAYRITDFAMPFLLSQLPYSI